MRSETTLLRICCQNLEFLEFLEFLRLFTLQTDLQTKPLRDLFASLLKGFLNGLLAVLLAICAVLLILKGLAATRHEAWIESGDWMKSAVHLRNFIITIGCLVFYILASEVIGFLLCGVIILSSMFWALAVRRGLILPLAVLITLVIHTVFYKGLRVPLPWGVMLPLQW